MKKLMLVVLFLVAAPVCLKAETPEEKISREVAAKVAEQIAMNPVVIEYVQYQAPEYAKTQLPNIWKAIASWISVTIGY